MTQTAVRSTSICWVSHSQRLLHPLGSIRVSTRPTRPEHSEPAITALHTVDWAEQRKPAASIPISTEQVIPVGRYPRASADRDRSRSLEPSGARVTHPHPSSRHRLHRVCLVLPCPSPSWQG